MDMDSKIILKNIYLWTSGFHELLSIIYTLEKGRGVLFLFLMFHYWIRIRKIFYLSRYDFLNEFLFLYSGIHI